MPAVSSARVHSNAEQFVIAAIRVVLRIEAQHWCGLINYVRLIAGALPQNFIHIH